MVKMNKLDIRFVVVAAPLLEDVFWECFLAMPCVIADNQLNNL